jgi:hypothetical protein
LRPSLSNKLRFISTTQQHSSMSQLPGVLTFGVTVAPVKEEQA